MNQDVPFTTLYKHRSARALAEELHHAISGNASVVLIQQGDPKHTPLFLVHPALRTSLTYNRYVCTSFLEFRIRSLSLLPFFSLSLSRARALSLCRYASYFR